jgi:hypothetical protein
MIYNSGELFTAPRRIVITPDDTPFLRFRLGVYDWKKKGKPTVPYTYKFASPGRDGWRLHESMPEDWDPAIMVKDPWRHVQGKRI